MAGATDGLAGEMSVDERERGRWGEGDIIGSRAGMRQWDAPCGIACSRMAGGMRATEISGWISIERKWAISRRRGDFERDTWTRVTRVGVHNRQWLGRIAIFIGVSQYL